MPKKYRNFSPEFREEAARMVIETSRVIADVARELGISETSLGNWVRAYREKHAADEPPLQLSATPGTLGVSACSGCCGLRVPCLSWCLFSR